jgi:UDP-N-acetylglucosamine 2-epimerase (hydrolysing)
MSKKILFLTGTRADFGKIKSLIQILEIHPNFEPYIFVTGMHLQEEYGYTLLEVERCGFQNIHTFQNHTHETTMDLTLAKTIEGLSAYVKECKPNMIATKDKYSLKERGNIVHFGIDEVFPNEEFDVIKFIELNK